MDFLKDIKSYCAILGVAGMLSSCAAAVFPDVPEDQEDNSIYSKSIDENGNFVTKSGKKIDMPMPEEGDTLSSDKKNVAYEDDPELEDAMNPNILKKNEEDAEKVKAVSTVPVLVEDEAKSEKDKKEKKDTFEGEALIKDAEAKNTSETSEPEEENTPSISYQLETFYFANGSTVLEAKYNSKIREIVKIAKTNNGKIKVLGFASSRTRNTDIASHKLANFKVSAERAQAVASALRRAGLPAEQLETEALSDSSPAYLEVMPEGERLNRRAEVYISY